MASEMQAAVATFVGQVMEIVRKDILRTVEEVMADTRSAMNGGKPGQKRDPEALAATVKQLGEYIAANPGQGVEQIGAAIGHSTSELALPIRKLIDAKIISRKGNKRSTKYFPKKSDE